jgi:putative transposase
MKKSMDFRRGRTCVFMMHVHLVFVTKYRRKVFTKEIVSNLEAIFSNVCQRFQAELIECDSEDDHIHLLINYPPTCTISRLVNSLKGVSSRLIRKENYPFIQQALWGKNLWSPSYFSASCGGASLDVIKQYIENQQIPD